MLIKPKALHAGSRIATISNSWGGPGTFPHRYQAGKAQLEAAYDVTVIEMPHTLADPDWIYKNPQARADDMMAAFADPDIDGIIATIGGDDYVRLLPLVDLNVITQNPKVFCGYSDTTVSHMMCYQAGIVSFYGPSIMAGFGENAGIHAYTRDNFYNATFADKSIGTLPENREGWTVEHLDWSKPELQTQPRTLQPCTGWRYLQGSGIVRGHLLGGCYEVLEMIKGTPLWPSLDQWQNAILFIETSEEGAPPAALKYALRNYAAAGILKRLSGLLIGRPGGQINPTTFTGYDEAVLSVIRDEEGLTELPIVSNMDFGHTDPMLTLPIGVQAEINCDHQTVSILESAVVKE
jgi:muramoyltetrapeptide carboxypeptidase LdcA involved in peptidoglycan recycling